MKLFLLIVGVPGIFIMVCFLWAMYQRHVYLPDAWELYMAKFNELKNLEFDLLLQRLGKPHEKQRYTIRGHQFEVGWRVDEPGALMATAGYVTDGGPQKAISKPLSEIEEVEVNGYVDYIYPIPFSHGLQSGSSMNFFKKKNGELRIIFPRLKSEADSKEIRDSH